MGVFGGKSRSSQVFFWENAQFALLYVFQAKFGLPDITCYTQRMTRMFLKRNQSLSIHISGSRFHTSLHTLRTWAVSCPQLETGGYNMCRYFTRLIISLPMLSFSQLTCNINFTGYNLSFHAYTKYNSLFIRTIKSPICKNLLILEVLSLRKMRASNWPQQYGVWN